MSDAVISVATAGDVQAVAVLERACYADPWPESAFVSLPGRTSVDFRVARLAAGADVVGYLVALFVADEGEIANLAVAPGVRRRGIATALLDTALAAAGARGVRALFLEVRESNRAARQLYASRAFDEVGRRRRYYRSPEEDALILRCTLDSGMRQAGE